MRWIGIDTWVQPGPAGFESGPQPTAPHGRLERRAKTTCEGESRPGPSIGPLGLALGVPCSFVIGAAWRGEVFLHEALQP